MSAPIVQAQYDQLEQIAARFAAAAEQQQALQERVNRQVDVLRGGSWQGRGVTAFLREMDGAVGPAGRRLADTLVQASGVSAQIVLIIQQADSDAASPFQSGISPNGFKVSPGGSGVEGPLEYVELGSAADLYDAVTDANSPPIRILRVGNGPDGKGEYVVLLKGTHGWFADTPRSWWANPRSGLGIPTQYTDAIQTAILQAGLPPGATMHFAGHSQGGHNAQLVAKIFNDAGVYKVGSVTAFGAYQVVSLPKDIPMNTYMFPTDPINLANHARDSLFYGPPGVIARTFGGQAYADDWIWEFGDHGSYGKSKTMQNTPLPFSSNMGEVVDIPARYSDPKTKDILQVVVEKTVKSAKHTTDALANSLPLLQQL